MRALRILGRSAVLAVVGGCFDLGEHCANEQLADIASPGGRWHAVVFQRSCGATTGFSTQISVLSARDTLPNEGGNAFTADTDHGVAPAGLGGVPSVSVRWIASDTLEVRFHPRSRVITREAQVGAVAIRYVADSISVAQTITLEATCEEVNELYCNWRIETPGVRLFFTYDGHGRIETSRGTSRQLKFPLPPSMTQIDRLYFAPRAGDVLLIYEAGNGPESIGGAFRLDVSAAAIRWHLPIPTLNVGVGALEDSALYVSGGFFIGCIDVDAGRYKWEHPDIQITTSFGPPTIAGDTVTFEQRALSPRMQSARYRINKRTGEILR